MRNEILAVILVLLVVGSLGVGYLVGSQLGARTTTSIAFLTKTMTVTTTVVSPSNTTYGSFTYAPTGQVLVYSVRASETQAQNGKENVTFWVSFVNIGNAPIYFIGGFVNELSSTIATNSSVLQEAPSLRCAGAIYITTLNHGQNYTVYTPDCGTGFNYQLVHPGSINVQFSFNWTTNHQETTPFSNSTTIQANFVFS